MRMRFTSVYTNDEDRAIDFYVNKMGFELMMDNPTNFGGRFLAFQPPGGGTWLVMSRPIPGMPAQVGGMTRISFEVDDVEATYEALKAKGVEFPQAPTRRFWGGVEAQFKDPDGNIFMLQQGGV
jgi:catechol 2,3-dioxygenase-like lactoylglutathione lyase family enzyme